MGVLAFLSGMPAAGGIIVLILGAAIYFIPSFVAVGNRNTSTVVIVNIFFGWTLIGWVVALVMAFADSAAPVVVQTNGKADKYDQLERLNQLREKGVLSTEEFIQEKEKVMKA